MAEEPKKEQETPKAPEQPAAEAKAEGPKTAPAGFKHILGQKLGMTQIFDKKGNVVPVTAVRAGPCPVVLVRTKERDGYCALQIGYGSVKPKNACKALEGHCKKAGLAPVRHLREFRYAGNGAEIGQTVTVQEAFKVGDYVDIRGVSKGKGFAGVMKRHGFGGLPGAHGASDKERSPGSLASRRSLGRVLPGQRMAGHMGAVWVTTPHLEIVNMVPDKNLLYIKGAVPGASGGLLEISETVKSVKHYIPKVTIIKKTKDPLKAAKQAARKK